MFRKISQAFDDYITTLTVQDLENPDKVKKEIENIEKSFTDDERLSTNVTFNNNRTNIDEFLRTLKQKEFDLNEKSEIGKQFDTNLFHYIGGKNVDISTEEGQDSIKRELAAIEKQIQIREESLALIDNFIVTLLTGEVASLNINANTNLKFIKVADGMHIEADEEIEDYYNDLYEDSEGSPSYGTALEHPKQNVNKLTTDIKPHTSSKFIKKK